MSNKEQRKRYYEKHKEQWKQYAINSRTEAAKKVKELKRGIEIVDKPEKLTMTVKEMAEALEIGVVTAYQLVNSEGFYPAFNIGRKKLINREKLKEWLNDQTTRR